MCLWSVCALRVLQKASTLNLRFSMQANKFYFEMNIISILECLELKSFGCISLSHGESDEGHY